MSDHNQSTPTEELAASFDRPWAYLRAWVQESPDRQYEVTHWDSEHLEVRLSEHTGVGHHRRFLIVDEVEADPEMFLNQLRRETKNLAHYIEMRESAPDSERQHKEIELDGGGE